jgi:hypothetical protein
MKTIKYYIWYFYFCVYWSAFEWGARSPQSNATNLFGVILVIGESIILQIAVHFGYQVSNGLAFVLLLIPPFLIPPFVFNNKKIKPKLAEFFLLKNNHYHNRRIIVVVSVLVFLILINTVVAILRNIYDS